MLFVKYLTALFSFFSFFAASYAISPDPVPLKLEDRSPSGSAGLRWGPYYVGALKLYITNPHTGYAGPKFNTTPHINVHVDRKAGSGYEEVVNVHVVKYTKARKQCLYMWDSKFKRTVFEKCFHNFGDAAKEAGGDSKTGCGHDYGWRGVRGEDCGYGGVGCCPGGAYHAWESHGG